MNDVNADTTIAAPRKHFSTNKELDIKPGEDNAQMIMVATKQVGDNPFRDKQAFPIDEVKTESLAESMLQTGYWPSILARPKNNRIDGELVTQTVLDVMIEQGYDFSTVDWEQAFGHHRKAAVIKIGKMSFPLIVRIISDDDMLRMMSNENKEGYGSNFRASLETVRQVRSRIMEDIAGYGKGDFEDYQKDGGEIFLTSAKFDRNVEGVTAAFIKEYLGDSWKVNDVRIPAQIIALDADGRLAKEMTYEILSNGHIDQIQAIINFMWDGGKVKKDDADAVDAPNWPNAARYWIATKLCELCGRSKDGAKTVSALKAAFKAIKTDGVNPITFLGKPAGETTKTAFVVQPWARRQILGDGKEGDEATMLGFIEAMKEDPNWNTWDGLEDCMTKLIATVKTIMEARLKGDPEPENLDGEDNPAEGGDSADASVGGGDDAQEDADGSTTKEAGVTTAIFNAGDTVGSFLSDGEILVNHCQAMTANIGSIDVDEHIIAGVDGLLESVINLAVSMGRAGIVVEMYSTATKAETVAPEDDSPEVADNVEEAPVEG